MFRIKVCGITSVNDAQMVVESGADAIGLNFASASPRCVSPDIAQQIVAVVRGRVMVVGVFVNSSLQEVKCLADQLPLDLVQLHGDESASFSADLAPRKVIRAFRARAGDESAIVETIASHHGLGVPLEAILVDAFQDGVYGGTGKTVNWGSLRILSETVKLSRPCHVVLAGGLHPGNVREAILESRCDGVDVASGVELRPGVKQRIEVRRFVESARRAFEDLVRSQP